MGNMGNNGTSRHGMRRMGDVLAVSTASLRSARPITTRKPRRDHPVTPEQLQAKVAALQLSASGEPSQPSARPAGAMAPARVSCAQCGDIGWVRVAEIGPESQWQARLAPCGCQADAMARERWQRALAASDVSPALRLLTFADYDARYNAIALAAAQSWTQIDGYPWLFLYGGPGSGKTHLLAAAFNAVMDADPAASRGRYPLYTVVPSLLDHIREGLDDANSREYGARFKAVREASILLLDDLGAEKRSEWSDELLFKLLDYRYREQLPTAVASNLIPADLEMRIASRLQDRMLSVALLMTGPDYRLRRPSRKAGA